jgi:hypothetical protein
MYADKYGGQLPPEPGARGLDYLRCEQLLLSSQAFICPCDKTRHQAKSDEAVAEDNVSYVYQPGRWFSSSNEVVKPLCWDKPGIHGASGLGVLFSDGHVTFLTTQMWSRVAK